MTREFCSRIPTRGALAAVVVAALVVSAGCSGVPFGGGGDSADASGDGTAATGSVPSDSTSLAYLDVDAMVGSDAHRQIANAYLEAYADAAGNDSMPTSLEAALTRAENQSGLDPSKLAGVTVFENAEYQSGNGSNASPMGGPGYQGSILDTAYGEDEFVSAMEERSDRNFSESTYNGVTMYRAQAETMLGSDQYIAVLGDGRFVVGSEAAVKDAVDVAEGDADAVSGELVDAYESTHDGMFRFAGLTPQETAGLGGDSTTVAGGMVGAVSSVTSTTGSYYVADGNVTMEASLRTSSESNASQLADTIDGLLSLYRGSMVQNESVQELLSGLSVDQDGSNVVISWADSVEDLEEAAREAGRDAGESGGSPLAGSNSSSSSTNQTASGSA